MIRSDSVFFLLCSIFPGWFCAERTHPHRARGSGEPLCGDAGLRHAARRSSFQEGHADRRAGGDRWRRVRFLLKTTLSASVHYGGVSQTVHLIHYSLYRPHKPHHKYTVGVSQTTLSISHLSCRQKSSFLPSYIIDVRELDEKLLNIIDMKFLHGYYEPTLLILYEPNQTWPGYELLSLLLLFGNP